MAGRRSESASSRVMSLEAVVNILQGVVTALPDLHRCFGQELRLLAAREGHQ